MILVLEKEKCEKPDLVHDGLGLSQAKGQVGVGGLDPGWAGRERVWDQGNLGGKGSTFPRAPERRLHVQSGASALWTVGFLADRVQADGVTRNLQASPFPSVGGKEDI